MSYFPKLPTNKIFIPARGNPKVITTDQKEFKSVLDCNYIDGRAIVYLEYFGYQLTIFMDDNFLSKDLPRNNLATIIMKENIEIWGDCILFDDKKELSMDDLKKMVNIAMILPSSHWIPEPLIEEFIRDPPKPDNAFMEFGIQHYNQYIQNNPRKSRLITWNKVNKFYVPLS